MRFLIAFLALTLCGCAVELYECKLDPKQQWQRLHATPSNVIDVLESASEREKTNLLQSETVRWYGNADGSFLACVPGEARGTCGKSDFWRENGCGQAISVFRKTAGGWKQTDEIGVMCTCDPKVSR